MARAISVSEAVVTRAMLLAAAGLWASCQLLTDFELDPVAEQGAELCSDGLDNDYNGLVDCQNFSCLTSAPCCDILDVLFEDDFRAGDRACADCARACEDPAAACLPHDELWHAWPCPLPRVCEGGLRLDIETEVCHAIGALARHPLPIEAGLHLDAEVAGAPERDGYLEVGLTLDDERALAGAAEACGPAHEVDTFASVVVRGTGDSLRLAATLRGDEIGHHEVGDADTPRTIGITILFDRRLEYSVDGVPFATSAEPLPRPRRPARLVLVGNAGPDARILQVRARAGQNCPVPDAFALAGQDLASSISIPSPRLVLDGYDGDAYHPAVLRSNSQIELYFTACRSEPDGSCEANTTSIGRAVERDAEFEIEPRTPVFAGAALAGADASNLSLGAVSADEGLLGLAADQPILRVTLGEGPAIGEAVFGASPLAAWDRTDVCCPSLVEVGGQAFLFYAARQGPGHPFHIGVAISEHGGPFLRPVNRPWTESSSFSLADIFQPVLSPGAPGEFDAESIKHPTVVYDERRQVFRMWYQATDFFGRTTIGYAVSADGLEWVKWSGNPALDPEEFGLASFGAPAALLLADGTVRMWIDATPLGATTIEDRRRRIIEFSNRGVPYELVGID
jgi:hypothetical protein